MANKGGTPSFFQAGDNPDFYKSLLDDMVTFVAVLDKTGTILFVNNTPLIIAGITLEEVKGEKFWNAPWWTYSEDTMRMIENDVYQCSLGNNLIHEIQLATADGTLMWIEYSMHPIRDENGNVEYLVPEGRDVSKRKDQEALLRRSLKMDALGKLTAGIAHDYNNILGIVHGYSELIGEHAALDPMLAKYVSGIQNASARGSALTRKLLAFTQQKVSEKTAFNVNEKLKDLKLLIEKTLTAKVTVLYDLEDDLWLVELDSHDLEDSIINICINSMYAMEGTAGHLSIATSNQTLDVIDAAKLSLEPGAYVTLAITDTGYGMDESTLEKIFDPFFTTKGDQGTGLGMSQVHGFVQRSGGAIAAFSNVGEGTRLVLYFPRSFKPSSSIDSESQDDLKLNGNESILIVDDEVEMANIGRAILQPRGYRVFVANDAQEALKVLGDVPVDLMISDVIMPKINGYELASIVQERYPQTKIQLVSGFEDGKDENTKQSVLRNNIIYKPYTTRDLLTHVRQLLNSAKP